MSSWRALLGIWLVALALAGAAWWLYLASPVGAQRGRGPQPVFPENSLPIDEVERVSLSRPGEAEIVMERRAGAWMQVKPFEWPLQAGSVRQLVAAAARLEISRRITAEEMSVEVTPATLGVEPAEGVVKLEWPGGTATVEIGRPSVAGRGYVRLAGERDVLVVGQELHDRALAMDPREWRSRTLFQGAGAESSRIEYARGETRVVLSKERRRWRLESPVSARVEPAALESLFRALGSAQAVGFIADEPQDLSRYGLDRPVGSLTVTAEERAGVRPQQQLLIGETAGVGSSDRYGMVVGRPVVVKIPAAALAQLFPSPETLIDPIASGVTAADIKSIRIDTPETTLLLERKVDQWVAPELEQAPVESRFVEELLTHLTTSRASEIAIQAFPQELSIGTVTFLGFDGRPMDTVRIARTLKGDQIGLENGDGVLRVFPASINLRLTPAAYGLGPASP